MAYYALTSRSQMFFKVGVLETWRPATLLKRASGRGVFLWILRNFYKQIFLQTPPLVASARNFSRYFTFYFQVVNSGCTIWGRELLFTWKDISCSFICIFLRKFFLHTWRFQLGLALFHQINLIKWNTSYFFKFDQIWLYALSNLIDSINLIKLIWPFISL